MDFIRWIALSAAVLLAASQPARAHTVATEMAEAAQRWLAALTPAQREQAVFAIDHPERLNWHFVPRERKGLPLKDLTPAQRHLVTSLLASALSHRGLMKASTIMSLEQVLHDLQTRSLPVRDPELYYVTVFGEPSATGTWGWRFEGHHLALNFLIHEGHEITVTPSMFGSNPAEVKSGPRRGLRVLGTEEDLARELVLSLDAAQWRETLLPGAVPGDVILTPSRPAALLAPAGLPASRLTAAQRERLDRLVEEYVRRYRPELADEDLKRMRAAGPDRMHFAWAGEREPGRPHYYRVQGPTFVLEYDNTQDGANHVHSLWRDTARDLGVDLLREHYANSPHHQTSTPGPGPVKPSSPAPAHPPE